MPSQHHKDWVTAKKTLSEATLKLLKQNKHDLGPNLDKFDKAKQAIDKEFSYTEPGKGVSKLIDSLKKTSEEVSTAAKAYAAILKTDNNAAACLKKLNAIEKDVTTAYQDRAKKYAAVRQK